MLRHTIVAGFISVLGAVGTEYHVAPDGRDGAPFRTIGEAVALLQPGDT